MAHLVEVKDVYKIYNPGENEVRALDGVSLTIDEGEFVAIIGQSGSGKSTWINENNLENFSKAWQHHYDNNPHHWQHRRLNTDFDKKDLTQVVNVLENVCDWLAVGYLYKNRPYQYYEKHKDVIELCPAEKEFFEHILYSLDKKEIGVTDYE